MEPDHNQLWAVSSIDGRYRHQLNGLGSRFSEGALLAKRTFVELKWIRTLTKLALNGSLGSSWSPSSDDLTIIDTVIESDLLNLDIARIKDIEKETNHDVKAVEYYLKELLRSKGVSTQTLAMIHFPCTSEDINNLSYGLMLKDIQLKDIIPSCSKVIEKLKSLASEHHSVGMLSYTHGQPATPTTLGKEFAVFGHRLNKIFQDLSELKFDGKISGAVGNYNAHYFVYPNVDWEKVADEFVSSDLDLLWNPVTTQIENHDGIAKWCHLLSEYQTVSMDLVRDIWSYISMGYFKQQVKAGEVGSSTMPHKVNPIDFENAEGNYGLSIAMAEHFANKLPISRLQRDLSDSTALRALGSMIGHFMIGQNSVSKGLDKIYPDPLKISHDLDQCYEILAEPFQMALRSCGIEDAYERLKALTRGKSVTRAALMELIEGYTSVPEELKIRLKELTPSKYLGISGRIAQKFSGTGYQR